MVKTNICLNKIKGGECIMTRRRVRSSTRLGAKRKASGANTVVSKVNYIKGTASKGKKTYDVTTHKRK